MDIQRYIGLEGFTQEERAEDDIKQRRFQEPALHTFLVAASRMPNFSPDELKRDLSSGWRENATAILHQVEVKAQDHD